MITSPKLLHETTSSFKTKSTAGRKINGEGNVFNWTMTNFANNNYDSTEGIQTAQTV